MSSLDDRRLYRRGATLTATDLAIALGWCFGGLLLRVAALVYTGSVVPMWWTN